jgi:hypothetical protein
MADKTRDNPDYPRGTRGDFYRSSNFVATGLGAQ